MRSILLLGFFALAVSSCATLSPMNIKAKSPEARVCVAECTIEETRHQDGNSDTDRCETAAKGRCQALLCSGELACVLETKSTAAHRDGNRMIETITITRPQLFKNE